MSSSDDEAHAAALASTAIWAREQEAAARRDHPLEPMEELPVYESLDKERQLFLQAFGGAQHAQTAPPPPPPPPSPFAMTTLGHVAPITLGAFASNVVTVPAEVAWGWCRGADDGVRSTALIAGYGSRRRCYQLGCERVTGEDAATIEIGPIIEEFGLQVGDHLLFYKGELYSSVCALSAVPDEVADLLARSRYRCDRAPDVEAVAAATAAAARVLLLPGRAGPAPQ